VRFILSGCLLFLIESHAIIESEDECLIFVVYDGLEHAVMSLMPHI